MLVLVLPDLADQVLRGPITTGFHVSGRRLHRLGVSEMSRAQTAFSHSLYKGMDRNLTPAPL